MLESSYREKIQEIAKIKHNTRTTLQKSHTVGSN